MRNHIAAFLCFSLLGMTSAFADNSTPSAEGPYVEVKEKGVKFSGYVDAGYSYNFTGDTTANNLAAQHQPSIAAIPLAGYDRRYTQIRHPEYLVQAGFRGDVAPRDLPAEIVNLQPSPAADRDSLYVQQQYVHLRAPVGNGLDFNVDRFVTPIGYAVQERPANLNITYNNLFVNAQPLNHVGVISQYRWNDTVDTSFSAVNGANSDSSANGDSTAAGSHFDNRAALLASVNLTAPGGNANIRQTVYYAANAEEVSNTVADNNETSASDNTSDVLYDVWRNKVPEFAIHNDFRNSRLPGFNADLGYFNEPLTLQPEGSINVDHYVVDIGAAPQDTTPQTQVVPDVHPNESIISSTPQMENKSQETSLPTVATSPEKISLTNPESLSHILPAISSLVLIAFLFYYNRRLSSISRELNEVKRDLRDKDIATFPVRAPRPNPASRERITPHISAEYTNVRHIQQVEASDLVLKS